MVELAFGLIVLVGLSLGLVALFGYWHISDKLWRTEMHCIILENWCDNLASNLVKTMDHVDALTQAHNRFVHDMIQGKPPSDINEADWWKKEDGQPPWTPENN